MKLTMVFLTAAFLTSHASGVSQKINFSGSNVPIAQIFALIEKQTSYVVLYTNDVLKEMKPVSIKAENMSLEEFLRSVMKNQPLGFTIKSKTIIISAKTTGNDLSGTYLPITGIIRDASGNPLMGATVQVKGKALSTVTDEQGRFTLTVNTGEILVVSFVGLQNREIKITDAMAASSSRSLNIQLLPSGNTMDTTVVITFSTGYQTLSKDRSTGSFSTVSGDRLAFKSGSMNVVDRLEGMVPGLSVNYGDGNDKLLLRGVTSVNLDRQPLIVLDGVPVAEYRNIESLVNPQDVKDITVLKDATAASIWGAQAANGVIVITTKSGEYNSNKINIVYDGFVTFKGRPDYNSLNLMSAPEFIATSRELFKDENYIKAFPYATITSGAFPKVYPHEQVFYDLNSGAVSASVAGQRWDSLSGLSNRDQIDKNFYHAATITSHSISLSGGGKVNKFAASLSYNRYSNNDTTTKDRYAFNLKEEWRLAPWLTFDLTGNMSYEKNSVLNMSYPMSLDQYIPYALFADGKSNALPQSYLYMTDAYRNAAEAKSKTNLNYIPLNELDLRSNDNSILAARVNAGLKIKLYKGLTFSTRGQYQKTIEDGYTFYDQNAYRVRLENAQFTQSPATAGGDPVYFLPTKGGHYFTNNLNVSASTIRNQLEYNRQFANAHQITALAGHEIRKTLFNVTNTMTRGYDFQTQTYASYDHKLLEVTGVSNAVLPVGTAAKNTLRSLPIRKAESELRFVSYYGNVAYAYKNKYNFNGSLRFDQSNLFATSSSSQNKPIWSAGVSWNVEREDFFRQSLFSHLALRATYGLSGNSPRPGLGGVDDVLYANSNAFYNGLGTGYIIISPANKQLVWEKTVTTNLGIDFEILARRISGSIDYYNKQTSELLGDRPLDPTTGWYSSYGNLSELYNRGVEISVNSRNITNRDFSWSTSFNISYNKNKITKLKRYAALGVDAKTNGGFIEGYSAYSLFAYKYAGLNADGNPLVQKEKGGTGAFTNQLTLEDTYYQGSTQPLWYGGITNVFRYKQFSLSGLIVYNLGNVMRSNANQFYTGRMLTNIQENFNDRWQKPGDEANTNVPRYVPNETTSASQRTTSFYTKSDVNVTSASYLRLRDLTLSFNLQQTISKLHIQQAKVFVQMNNMLLWTKNKEGIDPEYYNLSTGTRFKKAPPFYTIGLNLSF